jgi:hypothetical protein
MPPSMKYVAGILEGGSAEIHYRRLRGRLRALLCTLCAGCYAISAAGYVHSPSPLTRSHRLTRRFRSCHLHSR